MTEMFIHHFIRRFFEENACHVELEPSGSIIVHLTEKMDKAITNRPFYWKYMEATNQQGAPLELRFVTDKEQRDKNSEWITYGSPRLQQLGHHLKKQSQFTRLFEVKHTNEQTMLHPWLVINYRLSYRGKQKKETLFSIGLNLINGGMISGMMEQLRNIELSEVISNHCYTISPLIKLKSGFLRIENYIDTVVENEDHGWAVESQSLLQDEIGMIDYFYHDEVDNVEKQQEIEAAKKRFSPVITHEIVNGGLFYLDQQFLNK